MEDRLPAGYGRLALYLNRLRDRLHHLPVAHRRALLHRPIAAPICQQPEGPDQKMASFLARLLDNPASSAQLPPVQFGTRFH